jgi:biotin carboxylase
MLACLCTEQPMAPDSAISILCVTSYEKGQDFLRACKALGCTVYLLTVEKLRKGNWPREAIDEMFFMPEELPIQDLLNAVSYAARSRKIDRIVALDEFDLENVAAIREHLRLPGMGLTTVHYFRDKLAMRLRAREAGILVPEFVHVLNHDNLCEFMNRVPGPWLLKPRAQASGIGMKKINSSEELWPWLEQLGDNQSQYLLERFIPGRVFHVDGIVSEKSVLFAEAHAYGMPPLDVSHHGGIFTTRTLPRDSGDALEIKEIHKELVEALGLMRGVTHTEFLKSQADGQFYFLEIAARIGGAYISNVVQAATGINLWREWAQLEVGAGKQPYHLPPPQKEFAGVIISLARQQEPDTSGYTDPEIVYRISKYHHAGFVLKAASANRIEDLLASYEKRFVSDFMATQPVPDKPTS